MPMPLAQQNVSAIISWHWSHTLAPVAETPAGPCRQEAAAILHDLTQGKTEGW